MGDLKETYGGPYIKFFSVLDFCSAGWCHFHDQKQASQPVWGESGIFQGVAVSFHIEFIECNFVYIENSDSGWLSTSYRHWLVEIVGPRYLRHY